MQPNLPLKFNSSQNEYMNRRIEIFIEKMKQKKCILLAFNLAECLLMFELNRSARGEELQLDKFRFLVCFFDKKIKQCSIRNKILSNKIFHVQLVSAVFCHQSSAVVSPFCQSRQQFCRNFSYVCFIRKLFVVQFLFISFSQLMYNRE